MLLLPNSGLYHLSLAPRWRLILCKHKIQGLWNSNRYVAEKAEIDVDQQQECTRCQRRGR